MICTFDNCLCTQRIHKNHINIGLYFQYSVKRIPDYRCGFITIYHVPNGNLNSTHNLSFNNGVWHKIFKNLRKFKLEKNSNGNIIDKFGMIIRSCEFTDGDGVLRIG